MPSMPGPWTAEDVMRLFATNVVATTTLVIAYFMAAMRVTVDAQVVPVNVAVAALVVSGFANVTWVLRARRAVGVRSRRLLATRPADAPPTVASGATAISAAAGGELVGGDGLTRFHIADCPLAAGREWPAAPRVVHEAAERQPCGVCRP